MLKPVRTHQFKKDFKKILRQGKQAERLTTIMVKLAAKEELAPKHRDHQLTGNYKDRRECHIESDWILIYKIEDEKIVFERTGSHSELFK